MPPAGMDDYIAKPIRLEELSAALAAGDRLAAAPTAPAVDPAVIDRLAATSAGGPGLGRS